MYTVFTDALTGSSQGTLELAVERGSQDDSQWQLVITSWFLILEVKGYVNLYQGRDSVHFSHPNKLVFTELCVATHPSTAQPFGTDAGAMVAERTLHITHQMPVKSRDHLNTYSQDLASFQEPLAQENCMIDKCFLSDLWGLELWKKRQRGDGNESTVGNTPN